MRAITITSNNIVTEIETDGGYEFIRDFIGGWIEGGSIYNEGEVIGTMYMDEEGKLMNLPLNEIATAVYNNNRSYYDNILGDVIIFGNCDNNGYDTGVTDELADLVYKIIENRS